KTDKGDMPVGDDNEQKARNDQFKSWVKMEVSTPRRANGSREMILSPDNLDLRQIVKQYNFEETNDRYAREKVVTFLEKGGRVIVTNLNPNGDARIGIEVDPERRDIKLYKETGEQVSRDVYLKNNYSVKVGQTVELVKSAASEQ